MPLSLDLMPLEEKPPEAHRPKTIVVRYGYLKEISEFPSDLTSKSAAAQAHHPHRPRHGNR